MTYNDSTLLLPATARTATLTGLVNGTTYQVSVAATNELGTGSPSSSQNATPAGKPGTVAKPTAKVNGRTLTLTWSAAQTNGAAISAYIVTGAKPATEVVSGATRKVVFKKMKPGVYKLRVTAKNAVGRGNASPAASARVRR